MTIKNKKDTFFAQEHQALHFTSSATSFIIYLMIFSRFLTYPSPNYNFNPIKTLKIARLVNSCKFPSVKQLYQPLPIMLLSKIICLRKYKRHQNS